MARHNAKGRSKDGGRFVQLHHFLMETQAWRALKPAARAVYVEIATRYNSTNNGRLALSARDAARLCNINKDTATTSFRMLIEHGFIECATPGGFSRKNPHATEWRLTNYRCDVTGALPTKAYRAWRPPAQNAVPIRGQHCPKAGTVDAVLKAIACATVLDPGP